MPRVVVLGTVGTASVLGLAGLSTLGGGSAVVHQAAETAVKPQGQKISQPGWRIVDLTSATTYPGDQLTDVATVGSKDAWAVGSTGNYLNAKPLIRRWDGNSWRTVAAPPLPGGKNAVLTKVVAYSATDVWIFGNRQVGDYIGRFGFGLHWNGVTWKATDFGMATISDALVLGPRDVWVVGNHYPFTFFARHFDGRSWKKAAIPGEPWALSARSGKDIWAVGETWGGVSRATVSHWNGTKWRSMPRPRPVLPRDVEYQISNVFARGAKDVWATLTLRDQAQGGTPAGSLLVHWNGRVWTQVRLSLRKDTLFDPTPDGQGGLWLLSFVSPTRTDVLHYSKGKITRQKAPATQGTTGDPQSLALIPGTQSLWAAGDLVHRHNTVAAIYKFGS
ncbi:MAG: hypothetical protein JWN52_1958 [Actinomycetia bacterium]|nr:hypothetical protein [Actinomycetes bacterium]